MSMEIYGYLAGVFSKDLRGIASFFYAQNLIKHRSTHNLKTRSCITVLAVYSMCIGGVAEFTSKILKKHIDKPKKRMYNKIKDSKDGVTHGK